VGTTGIAWSSLLYEEQQPKNPPLNHNPMEVLFRTALEEEKRMLTHALFIVQQQPLQKKQLKTLISIIYRDDEVAEPIFRSWIRVSTWMKCDNQNVMHWMKTQMDQIRERLKMIVPIIEQMYGREETKFIVPVRYRE
jgi:hypothetical protein